MALFPVRTNPGYQPAAILQNYSGIARLTARLSCFYTVPTHIPPGASVLLCNSVVTVKAGLIIFKNHQSVSQTRGQMDGGTDGRTYRQHNRALLSIVQ